ncbi:MAG: hypothetical protein AB8B53_10975 [Flavobacteriales bacterium]
MQGFTGHKILLLTIGILLSTFLWAQDDFYIHGTVKQESTNQKMDNVEVQVFQDGKLLDSYATSGNSKYEFQVSLGHLYLFKFSKSGFVNKSVEVNTKNIPEEDQEGGFKLNMDMTLFEYVEGFNESIMDEPLGKAGYDVNMNDITFNLGHTTQMKNKITAERERLENAGALEAENRKKYEDLMIQGSDNMTKEKYEGAIGSYESALALFPDEIEAQNKLQEAKDLLALQNKDKELEAQYQALLKEGESLMKGKSYEDSKSKYEEASSLKPDQSEPKDKIRELEELIDAAGNQAQFDEFMAAGDADMSTEEYQSAVDNYMSARDIIPSDKGVQKKLTEAQEKLAALLAAADAEAAKEKRYNDLIDQANASFEAEDYSLSINQYNSALEIKPDEEYPQKQIDEANKRIKDLAAAAETDAANAEQAAIDAEYQGFIDIANQAFTQEDFDRARSNYQSALGVKPTDQYAKKRLERIDELEADALTSAAESEANAAQAAKDAEYQAFLNKANEAFTNDDLTFAKSNYQEALGIKPSEKFPKQRIKRIEEILAERDAELLADDKAAEEAAAKERELLAERERKAAEKAASEEEERLRLEGELAEKERLAEEERKRKEDADKRRNLTNNIDANAEKQAEEFYQQMKKTENQARYESLNSKKEELKNALTDSSTAAEDQAKDENSQINTAKNEMQKLYSEGENYQRDKRENFDSGDERIRAENEEVRLNADDRRKADVFKLDEFKKKDIQAKADANGKAVDRNAESTRNAMKEVSKAQKGYNDTGEVLRKDNAYKIDRVKSDIAEMKDDGEDERQKSEKENQKAKDERAKFIKENTELNDEKLASNLGKIDNAKDVASNLVNETDNQKSGNYDEVEYQKEKRAEMLTSNDEKTLLQSKINREEAFNLKKGEPKNYDDYIVPKGKEELAEGVTERSYEINEGRKLVIERTVKIGNKVDTFLKVIDKNATYYFKNNRSITKSSWDRETLYAQD